MVEGYDCKRHMPVSQLYIKINLAWHGDWSEFEAGSMHLIGREFLEAWRTFGGLEKQLIKSLFLWYPICFEVRIFLRVRRNLMALVAARLCFKRSERCCTEGNCVWESLVRYLEDFVGSSYDFKSYVSEVSGVAYEAIVCWEIMFEKEPRRRTTTLFDKRPVQPFLEENELGVMNAQEICNISVHEFSNHFHINKFLWNGCTTHNWNCCLD